MLFKSNKQQPCLGWGAALFVCSLWLQSASVYGYVPTDSEVLDLKTVQVVQPVQTEVFSKTVANNYIPTNMGPTTNQTVFFTQFGTGVQQKVTQKLTDYFMTSPMVKESGVTKTVDTVQKATATNVAIASTPGGITHKFSLNVKYAERLAVATYEGYFNLTTTYNANNNNMTTVLAKPLSKTTTVSLTNNSPPGQFNTNATTLSLSHSF